MKSVRVFVATVLCAMMFGAAVATATAETNGADYATTSAAAPGDDSGWGRIGG
ncbi:hypothetical protein ACH4Y0_33230 [Streptomyces sp. NPDC020707]|jgi:hypothetical protein|uniref:Uncharacterized protein n=1 Tax=Streptomyces ortus TaxID=2867268 RepID=A0ABT3VF16_9ACTN|nr:hypothetical protein [Streptomyces ortus]MCX4237061.1 hypothetical protein [Streptomyces ortus]